MGNAWHIWKKDTSTYQTIKSSTFCPPTGNFPGFGRIYCKDGPALMFIRTAEKATMTYSKVGPLGAFTQTPSTISTSKKETLMARQLRSKAANCPKYQAVGIDIMGNEDPSNTQTCYPTSDSAFVASCNAPDGSIGVSVQIRNELLPNLPEKYIIEDGWFKRNYRASELERRIDDEFLYMTAAMMMPEKTLVIDGASIFTTTRAEMKFTCKYSLKDQSVESTVNISGSDDNESRVGIGYLRYSLDLDSTSKYIGDRTTFTVSPTDPDLVYFEVQNCQVEEKEADNRVTIFGRENDFCVLEPIDFRVESGFGGMREQKFSFTSFKWTRSSLIPEAQTISCTLKLQGDPFPRRSFSPCPL